jgi:hypothetical protein
MGAYVATTITALNGTAVPVGSAQGSFNLAVAGVSPNTLVVEGSLDNTTWFQLPLAAITSAGFGAIQGSITSDGLYSVQAMDLIFTRVRASAYTSGTINVTMYGDVPVCGQAVTNVNQVGGGVAPAKYALVSASGATPVKNAAGTLFSIINVSATGLLATVTVKDGTTTVIPSNALLNSSPFSIDFGPAGMAFNTSLIVTLGGLLSTPVLVLYL